MCSDAVIGVNCSCYDGYQLVDNQNCTGKLYCIANMYPYKYCGTVQLDLNLKHACG